jgi:serine/threonine protein kinase/Tfp pilus assembly protein PilF
LTLSSFIVILLPKIKWGVRGMKCPKCNSENFDNTRFCGDCGTRLPSPEESAGSPTKTLEAQKEDLTTGSTFAGRYQVIEELGKGGMGKVYKALDKEIKGKVALKLIRPEIAADKKTIERFRNELKMTRDIAHKNVCRMYDLNKEEGTYYITMEYVSGEDLKSSIRRLRQLTPGTAILIAKQVCEGLAEAHRLGVVHRDLKPQNIMIDKEGNSRIMDFGIARSLKVKGITGAGVMIGTPEYMSPEQVEGKEVDQRSDIYSLGIILYEMVTGQVPFEGDTPFTIGVKHKSETPKDPKELNTQIPEDLSRVILKCMEKDKENRYQSAGELSSELTRIEKGIPTTERIVPKRKPITSREITVTFGLKKLLIPALVIIALAVISVVIWRLLPQKEAIPAPSGKPSLAVMYFKNNTGDESLDHLRTMLSDLLIADLTQSKHIKILSGDRLFDILSELNQLEAKSYSSKVLKEVAVRGGVNHILQGTYAKAGETFRINSLLQEAGTGELIGSESVEGEGEESIFSMVDELTRRIKKDFRLSAEEIASDIDKAVGKITTSSPEAYKYYSEGRKYFHKGEYHKSIQLMEKAVAIDSEFAMAYRSMWLAYRNMGNFSEYRKYRQKAFELRDRVSDREGYYIEGSFYAESEKTWDKSIGAYEKLLKLYPEDLIGNNNLGGIYMGLEEWDKAIERLEVLIQNKDETFYPYYNLAYIFMAKGLYDKSREILEYYLDNFTDNTWIHNGLAMNYLCQGRYDLALAEVDKAFSLNPALYDNLELKGAIYHCRGDFVKSEREYQKLLETEEQGVHLAGLRKLGALYLLQGKLEESKSQLKHGIDLPKKVGRVGWKSGFHLALGYIHLRLGSPKEALEEYKKAWDSAVEGERLNYQRAILHFRGLAYLEMKEIDEAQKAADELKEMIEKGMNKKKIRYYFHLVGNIELKRENFSKAIEYFKEAMSLLPSQRDLGDDHALFIDSLALTYYMAGDLEKAQEEYEKITTLTAGRLYYGHIYTKSFYMLGKIYEQKGWKGKAIEHYEIFLDLWKNADPGLPEVADARKRLEALQSQ